MDAVFAKKRDYQLEELGGTEVIMNSFNPRMGRQSKAVFFNCTVCYNSRILFSSQISVVQGLMEELLEEVVFYVNREKASTSTMQ
ncbi:unnamed protein product [Sphenostylis stenocarpa]|uniref:Uncharacterized protein n=1 Tax=Sphenostylis stenocarpa TaxID=92480 RepID=A0AA86VNB5_9FABA|nr:unnamed protein product [Sphenostylis stenocarpa]